MFESKEISDFANGVRGRGQHLFGYFNQVVLYVLLGG